MSKKSKVLDEQMKKDFEQYLHYRVGEADIPKTTSVTKSRFSNNIGHYLRGKKSYCNVDLRKIMDENPDIMGKLLYAKQVKQGLVKGSNIKIAQPKEIPSEITACKITENSKTPKTLDAFKSFIETLKSAGLSEITFKF